MQRETENNNDPHASFPIFVITENSSKYWFLISALVWTSLDYRRMSLFEFILYSSVFFDIIKSDWSFWSVGLWSTSMSLYVIDDFDFNNKLYIIGIDIISANKHFQFFCNQWPYMLTFVIITFAYLYWIYKIKNWDPSLNLLKHRTPDASHISMWDIFPSSPVSGGR